MTNDNLNQNNPNNGGDGIDMESLELAIKALKDIEAKEKIKESAYKVGYKKPPKSGQFKKGVSGNPSGRRKKFRSGTFNQALYSKFAEEITITNRNGKREKITLFEALAEKCVQDAISKDGNTRKLLLQNFKFFNFDFKQMIEDRALRDFQATVSQEDMNKLRAELMKKMEQLYLEEQNKQPE